MAVEVHHSLQDFRSACDRVRAGGGALGLVPTMGALHRGHLALVEAARRRSSAVAVTIFVNPTQFGPNEDLERYPRNLERDVELLRGVGADLVFAPAVSTMYPANERTRVHVSKLTAHLCGPKRPGHFEGVATIVTKLFAAAGPCVAVFGRKDYQQLKVVERLAADLLLPVEVVGYSTVRDADGLALSSRNAYLSARDRARALAIPSALSRAVTRFQRGERAVSRLVDAARAEIEGGADRVDYVTLAHPDELEPLAPGTEAGSRALLAVAAFVGTTRLIDNVVLGEDLPPIAELE